METDLQQVLTLDEAAALAADLGAELDRRHDLQEACRHGVLPAEQRGSTWLLTAAAVRAFVQHMRGLPWPARRNLYQTGAALVPSGSDTGIPPDLLVGYPEVQAYAQQILGWTPALDTLKKHRRHLRHRRAGRVLLTTRSAVDELFQRVWGNKVRLAGLPPAGSDNLPLLLYHLTRLVLGKPVTGPGGAEEVRVLQEAGAIAQAATGHAAGGCHAELDH